MTPVTSDSRPAVPPPSTGTCRGVVVWRTPAGRDVCPCTLPGGHAGDHRDAAGYAWNDERWLD